MLTKIYEAGYFYYQLKNKAWRSLKKNVQNQIVSGRMGFTPNLAPEPELLTCAGLPLQDLFVSTINV